MNLAWILLIVFILILVLRYLYLMRRKNRHAQFWNQFITGKKVSIEERLFASGAVKIVAPIGMKVASANGVVSERICVCAQSIEENGLQIEIAGEVSRFVNNGYLEVLSGKLSIRGLNADFDACTMKTKIEGDTISVEGSLLYVMLFDRISIGA